MSDEPHQDGPEPRQQSKPLHWRLGERPMQFGYIFIWIFVFVVAGVLSSGAGLTFIFKHPPAERQGGGQPIPSRGTAPTLAREAGLQMPAKVVGEQIKIWRNGRYTSKFLMGVNLGSAVPGEDPGGLAATRGDYERWFSQMGELGVQLLRIYTIQRPEFYAAFRGYNLNHPDAPILLLHGVWIPEDRWYETGNAFDPQVMGDMRNEIRNAVAASHGHGTIPAVPGHAAGQYSDDISPWMLGWSFGIEWDPTTVIETNTKNAHRRPYTNGTYITATAAASPMESWIAQWMDELAKQEVANGSSVPLTFTNWDTTDPLHHPDEPFDLEDAVSLDARHLRATESWPGGYFASFHAYPYYPDFLSHEPGLLNYRRADGVVDPYAGYINALRKHHRGMPLMITELGQPTALGCAHRGPLGRDQGCHSEQEAAQYLIDMMRDIQQEGAVGAVAFMWIDEWFKFTWNTIDYELPHERRSKWRSPLTNEEHFGFIAAEPGPSPTAILDGKDDEWETAEVIANGTGPVREVRALHDAEHLYLRLKVAPNLWQRERIVIGLDAHTAGNAGLPGLPGVDPGADVAVVITPGNKARMMHAGFLDVIGARLGGFADPERNWVRVSRRSLQPGSGVWVPLRQVLSYPFVVRSTGKKMPIDIRDASEMPWGTTDPNSPNFDDRHLIDGEGEVLEVAIPWGMATFADPSTHKVFELRLVPQRDKQVVARPIERLGISVAAGGRLLKTSGYTWDGWDAVIWHERKKAGWSILLAGFNELGNAPILGRP